MDGKGRQITECARHRSMGCTDDIHSMHNALPHPHRLEIRVESAAQLIRSLVFLQAQKRTVSLKKVKQLELASELPLDLAGERSWLEEIE